MTEPTERDELEFTAHKARYALAKEKVAALSFTWRVHILGPDDLIPMDSEINALREANMLNIALARVRLQKPNDPNMPWCMAVVERNGVEYTEDQYP